MPRSSCMYVHTSKYYKQALLWRFLLTGPCRSEEKKTTTTTTKTNGTARSGRNGAGDAADDDVRREVDLKVSSGSKQSVCFYEMIYPSVHTIRDLDDWP